MHTKTTKELRTGIHIGVPPLLAKKVDAEQRGKREQAECTTPPNDRRAKQVIFLLLITPAAHAQA